MTSVSSNYVGSNVYKTVNLEEFALSFKDMYVKINKLYYEYAILRSESKILRSEANILKMEGERLLKEGKILLASGIVLRSEDKFIKFGGKLRDAENKILQAKGKALLAYEKHRDLSIEKIKIPRFLVSGVVVKWPLEKNIQPYSRLVRLVIKGIDIKNICEVELAAECIPSTYFCIPDIYRTENLSILVKVDSNAENHNIAFQQVADFYEKDLGLKIERYNSSIIDFCDCTYHPDPYINPNCKPFQVNLEDRSDKIQS